MESTYHGLHTCLVSPMPISYVGIGETKHVCSKERLSMCVCIAIIYGVCMYVIMLLYLCMYIFYITLARKNGLGRLPEYNNQSIINQSINPISYVHVNVSALCMVLFGIQLY